MSSFSSRASRRRSPAGYSRLTAPKSCPAAASGVAKPCARAGEDPAAPLGQLHPARAGSACASRCAFSPARGASPAARGLPRQPPLGVERGQRAVARVDDAHAEVAAGEERRTQCAMAATSSSSRPPAPPRARAPAARRARRSCSASSCIASATRRGGPAAPSHRRAPARPARSRSPARRSHAQARLRLLAVGSRAGHPARQRSSAASSAPGAGDAPPQAVVRPGAAARRPLAQGAARVTQLHRLRVAQRRGLGQQHGVGSPAEASLAEAPPAMRPPAQAVTTRPRPRRGPGRRCGCCPT